MLGRVRTCSLSSLEVLEMERTPSKLLKDDSLSIYETTLMKLQQGSRRDLGLVPEESMNIDTGLSMAESAPDYNKTDSFPSSGNSESLKEQPHGSLSVLYMFSKYKSSRNGNLSSSDDSAMVIKDDRSSANTLPSHNPHLQQGCIDAK